jgi:hypothetical protein
MEQSEQSIERKDAGKKKTEKWGETRPRHSEKWGGGKEGETSAHRPLTFLIQVKGRFGRSMCAVECPDDGTSCCDERG